MFSCLQILEAFLWFVLITLLNVTLIILTLSVSRLLKIGRASCREREVHSVLKECFERRVGARSLVSSIKAWDISTLELALALAIDQWLNVLNVNELRRVY